MVDNETKIVRPIHSIVHFCAEEDGTTAVEYAVMLMLILLAVIGSVQFFGAATNESLEETSSSLSGALGN